MERNFAAVMSELRHARGLSQRKVAADLKISQALLSHYENGAREPGLAFVCRACDYYGVSADFLLGRAPSPTCTPEQLEALRHTLEMVNYKCWYYETAKAAGTTDVPQQMPDEDVPAQFRAIRRELRSTPAAGA